MERESTRARSFSVGMLSCGLTSGLLQAGLFNPWDRALYLSIKDRRPFLHVDNFRNPFSGVTQTIFQRALSSGLYFPLEEFYLSMLHGPQGSNLRQNKPLLTFVAGILSGITSGVIMNPIAAVKYHYWGTPTGKENFFSTAADMWRQGGLRIFVVGTGATVNRDLIFGGVYAFMRHELLPRSSSTSSFSTSQSQSQSLSLSLSQPQAQSQSQVQGSSAPPGFFVNLIAACSATIISSPWNYIRNVHYATERGTQPQSALSILQNLWQEALKQDSLLKTLRHLQTRLRIGWGSVSTEESVSCVLCPESCVMCLAALAMFKSDSCFPPLYIFTNIFHPPISLSSTNPSSLLQIIKARVGCGMAFGARFYDFCSGAEKT